MIFFKRLLLVLCFPIFLHAGIFDWLFSETKPTITQFECPYNCGGLGTEGLNCLDIQAMQVLWELDRFGHASYNLPFSYDIPEGFSSPWAEKLGWEGIEVFVNTFHKGIKTPYCQHNRNEEEALHCGCIDYPLYLKISAPLVIATAPVLDKLTRPNFFKFIATKSISLLNAVI